MTERSAIGCTWTRPSGALCLARDDLHIWRMPLSLSERERLDRASVLSGDEAARASKFISSMARDSFIAARAHLRRILAAYLNEDPAALRFSYGEFGKPFVVNGSDEPLAQFSLSHSGEIALLAVTASHALGVDVERVRADVAYEGVADEIFSAEERRHLNSLSGERRINAFFQYWTHKESVLKALGVGFSVPPSACHVDLDRGIATVASSHVSIAHREWRVLSLTPADGYVGAVAFVAQPTEVFWWDELP